LRAIEEADVVIMGPGSLYTSVIPNLIIDGMTDALIKSSAFKIYVCNVMTQHGETDGFTACDHLKAVMDHSNENIINACILNNAEVPDFALAKYRVEESYPVFPDIDLIRKTGCIAYGSDLLGVSDYVRHDSEKLNKAIIKIIEQYRVIKR